MTVIDNTIQADVSFLYEILVKKGKKICFQKFG